MYLSPLGDDHLWCVSSEHSKGKLGEKEKAAFSIKYLFVFDTLCLSGQPTSLHEANKLWTKSSELNGNLVRSQWLIMKELGPFKCPKVWNCFLVLRRFERVKFQNWNSVSDEIPFENLFATLAFRVADVSQWQWQLIALVIRQQMKVLHVTRPV